MRRILGGARRRALLALGLAAAIGASAVAPERPAPLASPVAAPPAPSPAPQRTLIRYERSPASGAVLDLFDARAAPAAEAPAPAKAAPAFPYSLLGIVGEGDAARVFMVQGERIFEVRPGQQLGPSYRLEPLSGPDLVFTYLPLNVQHRIAEGAAR